jgi:hypothetical protein
MKSRGVDDNQVEVVCDVDWSSTGRETRIDRALRPQGRD